MKFIHIFALNISFYKWMVWLIIDVIVNILLIRMFINWEKTRKIYIWYPKKKVVISFIRDIEATWGILTLELIIKRVISTKMFFYDAREWHCFARARLDPHKPEYPIIPSLTTSILDWWRKRIKWFMIT